MTQRPNKTAQESEFAIRVQHKRFASPLSRKAVTEAIHKLIDIIKSHISTTAMAVLIIALALSSCSEPGDPADGGEIDRTADEAAIRALLEANWAAGSARDAEGVQATYLRDGDAWIAGLSRISGSDELRRAEEEFGGMPGFQRYDGTIESIRFISPDAAIIEVSATTTLDSGSFDEEVTIVVARRDNNWGIAAWRVMTFDETLLNLLQE